MEKESCKFNEEEVRKLMDLMLRFVDIPKILSSIDSDLAESFKKKNGYAFQAFHENECDHHDHGEEDLCGLMHTKIFIPEKDMNTVEKLISEEIYPPRFKLYLKELLVETKNAYDRILEKMKKKSEEGEGPENVFPQLPGIEKPKALEFNEEECKQIMKKVAFESVNRFILRKVKKEVVEKEKAYAQMPALLAFPSGAPKTADLTQIHAERMSEFMSKGYTIQSQFIDLETCENCYIELLQLQREGRFQTIRTMQNIMEQFRNDQLLRFNFNQLGDEVEVKHLKKVCERLSWLPFELNKYCPDLSLQVNENMDIQYFSEKETYYKKHKNSDK